MLQYAARRICCEVLPTPTIHNQPEQAAEKAAFSKKICMGRHCGAVDGREPDQPGLAEADQLPDELSRYDFKMPQSTLLETFSNLGPTIDLLPAMLADQHERHALDRRSPPRPCLND